MIFRTLLFFLLMYLLIKVISRLFLPSDSTKKNKKGSGVFYQMYQQHQNRQNSNTGPSNNTNKKFDQIEEAEFEDITEEGNTTSKQSD